jgi:hypothetical protein
MITDKNEFRNMIKSAFKALMIGQIGLALGLMNAVFFNAHSLAIISSALFIGSLTYLIRKRLKISYSLSFFAGLAAIAVIFSVYYYLFSFHSISLVVLLSVFNIGLYAVSRNSEIKSEKFQLNPLVKSWTIFSLLGAWFGVLGLFSISESVRSPFDVLPTAIFVITFAICLSVYERLNSNIDKITAGIITSLTLFGFLSIFAITYPLGYGFDPFIHRATLEHIAQFGTITPKPLYYTGEYVIELIANLVFGFNIFSFNVWLVPVLAGFGIVTGLDLIRENWKKSLIFLMPVLLLPFSDFTYTTPQALSYIFTWLTFAVLLSDTTVNRKVLSYLFATTSLLMHPLAGIPAFIAIAIFDWPKFFPTIEKELRIAISIICSISLPIAFMAQALLSGLDISFGFTENTNFNLMTLDRYFQPWLDIVYSSLGVKLVLLSALSFFGLNLLRKNGFNNNAGYSAILLLVLVINYLILTSFVQFNFLIDYERQNYSQRLIVLIALASLPFIAAAVESIHSSIKESAGQRLALGLLLSIFITSNIYNSYPQNDGVVRSAGFNVSKIDLEAAHYINKIEGNELNYVVLANQNVSAAALQEFGFRHYFDGDIFYYPIPTGGELYKIYLEMTESRPTLEVVQRAKDLTGAETVYFVVNNYWWDAARIIELSKQITDNWIAIGSNDEVYIFTF